MFQVPGQQGMEGRTPEGCADFRRESEIGHVYNEGKHVYWLKTLAEKGPSRSYCPFEKQPVR